MLLERLHKVALRVREHIPFVAINIILRCLDKEAKSILDIGCGKGESMEFINRGKRFYTVGVDIFSPYLKICHNLGVYDGLILADARKLPFKPKTFDVVLLLEVVEHLDKKEGLSLLQEAEKIARRQILLTAPIGESKHSAEDGNPYQEHKSIWYPQDLEKLGYKVKRRIGLRGLKSEGNLVARFPRFLSTPLGHFLWVLAGPLAQFFPQLAGQMICVKTLLPKGNDEDSPDK